ALSSLYINDPDKQRIINMAISAKSYIYKDGRPSSWSAAIDNTTSGAVDDIHKLFIVSAGNVRGPDQVAQYPDINITEQIEDPGQSWNAITVGAYTNLDRTEDTAYQFLAKKGELSPFSRTSMFFDKMWPIKPEVVLEGGNAIKDGLLAFDDEDLSLLTTHHDPTQAVFTHFNATSAATAYAAWMAAKIQSEYPKAWPETVRGLLIHSAKWTEEMKRQFFKDKGTKGEYQNLLRTCGYGVPSLNRAIDTVSNRVNLIIQEELQPYDKVGNEFKTKDMHLYELPWPKEVLQDIYDKDVKLKVTLSYFIEPGPGEKGWKDKYRYASAGLRFALNGSNDKEDFVKRINKDARDEEDGNTAAENTVNWLLGRTNRDVGSIHSDTWVGTGADLATSNYIGVYPVIGWWRERSHLGKWNKKIRYSLIVTLEAPELNVDLLTPILNEIETRVDTSIETEIEF
ncbi:MAG TPA: S8 family peptidase, partial [Chitinophagaceae bacterium]|nr:S8 family peptidase [Chitinophagaceae bacterium]